MYLGTTPPLSQSYPEWSLADSVKLYAEAASLMQYCHATLEKTSLQIEEINAKIAETVDTPQEQEEE